MTAVTAADAPAELELQQRWAEGRWDAPWLSLQGGGPPLRICFAGRWNHAAGPDFRGAILLDSAGRTQRGDVELHRDPSGWRSHGHHRDPAYAQVLLHVVGAGAGGGAGPPLALLPAAAAPPAPPPCTQVLDRAGPAAVAARLRQLAGARLQRKAAALARRRAQLRGGRDGDELLAAWALARALGMPHNTEILGTALEAAWRRSRALSGGEWTLELRRSLSAALNQAHNWRTGRAALGQRGGAADALAQLLARGGRGGAAAACRRLAECGAAAAAAQLRLPRLLGAGRARQLLADAIYPAAIALGGPRAAIEQRWRGLAETRYLRTAALRGRLAAQNGAALHWRHGEAQALLELERGWCAQGACAVCPLGRLAGKHSKHAGGGALIPSLNLHAAP